MIRNEDLILDLVRLRAEIEPSGLYSQPNVIRTLLQQYIIELEDLNHDEINRYLDMKLLRYSADRARFNCTYKEKEMFNEMIDITKYIMELNNAI